jgi:hypothetical protein
MTGRQNKSRTRTRKAGPVSIETVRRIALALPGVEEGLSSGSPAFRVRGKIIARLHRDGESLLIKVDLLKRDILTNADPETFYVTDFYRCYPMVFVRLARVSRDVLRDLLVAAWRIEAPKRLVETYEGLSTDV